jgi:nucleotide-binding universal stress UspA family protein
MYKKVLIATDGSDIARRAAEHAFALAQASGGRVTGVFVIDTRTLPGAHPILPESMAPYYFSILEELKKAASATLFELKGLADKHGVPFEARTVEGTPAAAILDLAKETAADLLVMGTHGRTGLGALLIGSTTQAVVHGAACPVLLVR